MYLYASVANLPTSSIVQVDIIDQRTDLLQVLKKYIVGTLVYAYHCRHSTVLMFVIILVWSIVILNVHTSQVCISVQFLTSVIQAPYHQSTTRLGSK